MHQLEIQFFFPLTEQIPLDLDFTSCEQYKKQMYVSTNANTITLTGDYDSCLTASTISSAFTFRSDSEAVGAIEVTPDFHIYVKNKPNWLARLSMKKIFGWNWKDK